jgi:hypothetical protein
MPELGQLSRHSDQAYGIDTVVSQFEFRHKQGISRFSNASRPVLLPPNFLLNYCRQCTISKAWSVVSVIIRIQLLVAVAWSENWKSFSAETECMELYFHFPPCPGAYLCIGATQFYLWHPATQAHKLSPVMVASTGVTCSSVDLNSSLKLAMAEGYDWGQFGWARWSILARHVTSCRHQQAARVIMCYNVEHLVRATFWTQGISFQYASRVFVSPQRPSSLLSNSTEDKIYVAWSLSFTTIW